MDESVNEAGDSPPEPVGDPVSTFCGNGHQMAEDAKFCSECGSSPSVGSTEVAGPLPSDSPDGRESAATPATSDPPVWNAKAIVAFILTLVLGTIGGIVGIILGIIARMEVRESDGRMRGSGLALAAIIIGVIDLVVTAIAVIVVVAAGSNSTSSAPIDTSPISGGSNTPSGPPLSDLQNSVLTDWNKQEPSYPATSVQCGYDPNKWAPGYQFMCFAYNSSNSGVGQIQITSTSSATDQNQTWNESYSTSG